MNWDTLVKQCKLTGILTVCHGAKSIDAQITAAGTLVVVSDGEREEFARPSIIWDTYFPNRVSVCVSFDRCSCRCFDTVIMF